MGSAMQVLLFETRKCISQLSLTKKGEGGAKVSWLMNLQFVIYACMKYPANFHSTFYPVMHFHMLILVQTKDKTFYKSMNSVYSMVMQL